MEIFTKMTVKLEDKNTYTWVFQNHSILKITNQNTRTGEMENFYLQNNNSRKRINEFTFP